VFSVRCSVDGAEYDSGGLESLRRAGACGR
jgi:hypothetical protein